MSHVSIVGAGPAGLMAADILSAAGMTVSIHDRMPSPGRKFLMAGRGGLNLTHSEPLEKFLARYSGSIDPAAMIRDFPPDRLRAFAHDLGEETFVGTSGRVFPKRFKASPLLRAWLARLRERGVIFHMRKTFVGFDAGRPVIADAQGARRTLHGDATVLALGGASWPRLGSDGGWAEVLRESGVDAVPLRPANCGVTTRWSDATREKLAGAPLKRASFSFGGRRVRGEAVLTRSGLEGGAIYTLSSAIRDALDRGEDAKLAIDLAPDMAVEEAAHRLSQGRPGDSRANMLRKRLSLSPAALAVLRESEGGPLPTDLMQLAARVKNVSLAVSGVAGLDRAISTAGGIRADALDEHLMLRALPGIFVAGEMLDWDAPTGGYLLQACFASGVAAAKGVLTWLAPAPHPVANLRFADIPLPVKRGEGQGEGPSRYESAASPGTN